MEFLKTWSLRSNSVTRQKLMENARIKKDPLKCDFWVIFKCCDLLLHCRICSLKNYGGKSLLIIQLRFFIFHTLCDDRMWHFGSIWELLKCFWLICLSSCCYSIGRKLYLISSWINEKTPTLTRFLLACNPEEKILLLGCHIAYAYVLKDKQGHNMKKPSLLLEKLGLTIKEMNGG